MINIISILIGYLIGSISPAYFLGKYLKKIDIREVGEKSAGATNVYIILGVWPTIITIIFDLLKGLIAFFIAKWMGASEIFIYLAGFFAIVGHIFPFYLNFRGGQGAGTCMGLLIYFLYGLFKGHFLSLESIGILIAMAPIIYFMTHKKDFIALVIMPLLVFLILRNQQFNLLALFACLTCAFLFGHSIYNSYKKRLFKLKFWQ